MTFLNEQWADRQRDTNRLVRLLADYVFDGRPVAPRQLLGLCKLTWITNSFEGDNPAYIASTKIPALGDVFTAEYSGWTLEEIADDVAGKIGPDARAAVLAHTGFTNFYKAYRNTVKGWLADHFAEVLPILEAAYRKSTDDEGAAIIARIERLRGIPGQGRRRGARMAASRLLTPVCFALDSRLRFPLINGNNGVRNLLRKLHAHHAPLSEQYERMIGVYGRHGIKDAADLDQAGQNADLPDFLGWNGEEPLRKESLRQPTEGNELPLKDAADIEAIGAGGSVTRRRLHNQMTNRLRELLGADYNLQEGNNQDALFDLAIKNYDGEGEELFVEVKSSGDMANLRMAVGQLFSYWFTVCGTDDPHVAICLPEEPGGDVKKWLAWLEIGLLWLDENGLHTNTTWLKQLRRR